MANHPHDQHPHSRPRFPVRRPRAVARSAADAERMEEALTLALYASLGGSGLLFLVGTVAYGYFTMLSLL